MSMAHPMKDPCNWANFVVTHRGVNYDPLREPRRSSEAAIERGNARRKIEEKRMLDDIAGKDYWEH